MHVNFYAAYRMVWLIYVHVDMAASLLATDTVLVAERSGWTMFGVILWREISHTAYTVAGEITTVHTMMMYPSRALQVSLLGHQFTLYTWWLSVNGLKEQKQNRRPAAIVGRRNDVDDTDDEDGDDEW